MKEFDYKTGMEESKRYKGPLGALAYTMLKGLQLGGAEEKEIEELYYNFMNVYLPKLTDEQCNTLCDIVFDRLSEDKKAGKDGKWY